MNTITLDVNIYKHTDSEIWELIPGYPDYQASTLGRIKSFKSGKERILKPRKRKDGRLDVPLCNNGITKRFLVHRLVGMAFFGLSDDQEIDHRNGDPTDNRLENLRVCTHAENGRNLKKRRDNTSGFPGVTYRKRSGKYEAYIKINGKTKYLGLYDTAEEAFLIYKNTSLKLHGAFSPFVTRPEFKALAEQVSTFVTQDEFKALEERVSTLEGMLNLQGTKISDISEGVY